MKKARWIYEYLGLQVGTFRLTSRPCFPGELEMEPWPWFHREKCRRAKRLILSPTDIGFRDAQRKAFDLEVEK